MYVGLPLEYMEAVRLLGKASEEFSVEDYLKAQWSPLTFKWIDKKLWVLGVKVYSDDDMTHVEKIIENIKLAEKIFYIEAKRLNIDLSSVKIVEMESSPVEVKNAKPYLLEYN